ncbi:MAG: 30S ribosomal protein S1 [Candidatus Portnoybacteria bacterium CG10_big_fil_rev_8_21_14_0_10_36_7]|uniref:30S ribosomal protein S1 n=1 Tax=Candidatus Portnoybacteria bacterium CG10_big_fil_rev_8_21_14_0_10_36_7 TaxID=1974812 RepID=A0A2M8KDK6_9BACT|nr:MAG: 30S ribosomal protein S1 [Candidatus Portnoybacteria bacterium CG10_big_fil_rev_8_21_14_0_10_36_7]
MTIKTQSKVVDADFSNQPAIPQPGQTVDGIILEVGKKNILVDLPGYGTGVILGREIKNNPSLVKALKVGEKVSAVVLDGENDHGYTELCFSEAQQEKSWQTLHDAKKTGEEIIVRVMQANRGGLMVNYGSVSGFLPVSQLNEDNYPKVENGNKSMIQQMLSKLVGQDMKVKVLDADSREQKLIVSQKAKSQEEFKKLASNYKVGQTVKGTITGLTDFGAFIKFGEPALEGLIYISEIDWKMINHPSEVLKTGDEIEAKITDIKNGQITLSLKALQPDPWKNIEPEIKKGDVVDGEAIKLNPYGAFIKINPFIHGLIHISEFGTQQKMREKLEIGKSYKFEIILVDPKEHRLSLKLVDVQ